jgi:hypothetical protein
MPASSEFEDRGRRPFLKRRRRPWLRSSPPERFLGLVGDIAPRQSNVMKVPVGPVGQFVALMPAVKPDLQTMTEPGKNT